MTSREQFDQRQRALAAYAVAAQKVVSGIAEFFAATAALGNDPLEMSGLLTEAFEVLVDQDYVPEEERPRKRASAKGVRRSYNEAADLMVRVLCENPRGMTTQEMADAIESTTSAVSQTLRKMLADPEYEARIEQDKKLTDTTPVRTVNVWRARFPAP